MYHKKVDKNQKLIVDALRKHGFSVEHLHMVGAGVPDLLCGYAGINYLIEVKNTLTKGKLNNCQIKWHKAWSGQVSVVNSIDECINFILKVKNGS